MPITAILIPAEDCMILLHQLVIFLGRNVFYALNKNHHLLILLKLLDVPKIAFFSFSSAFFAPIYIHKARTYYLKSHLSSPYGYPNVQTFYFSCASFHNVY